jgi:hypothetical protein
MIIDILRRSSDIVFDLVVVHGKYLETLMTTCF